MEPARDEQARTVAAAATSRATTAVIAADPILSDDGWWQWDGSAWVLAENPPVPTHSVDAEQPAVPDAGQTHRPGSGVTAEPGYEAAPYYAHTTGYPAPAGYGPPPSNAARAGYGAWTGYPPPGYGPSAYGDYRQHGRDRLAIPALVCSLIPFVVTQVVAVVFAIITLTRVGRTRKKGQVMAIFAICISVLMFFVSVAIAIPVFISTRQSYDDAQARSALRNAAAAEQTYDSLNGTYADATQLKAAGERVPGGFTVGVADDGATGYCLAAGRTGGTRWQLFDSLHGGLQTTIFASIDDAIQTCTSGATASAG